MKAWKVATNPQARIWTDSHGRGPTYFLYKFLARELVVVQGLYLLEDDIRWDLEHHDTSGE